VTSPGPGGVSIFVQRGARTGFRTYARARWPSVVEIQGELAHSLQALVRQVSERSPAEASALRDREALALEPLERRGTVTAELRAALDR
jgi:hypothetical protein